MEQAGNLNFRSLIHMPWFSVLNYLIINLTIEYISIVTDLWICSGKVRLCRHIYTVQTKKNNMLSKLLLTAVNIQLITDGSQIHYFHLRAIVEYVPKIRWKTIMPFTGGFQYYWVVSLFSKTTIRPMFLSLFMLRKIIYQENIDNLFNA